MKPWPWDVETSVQRTHETALGINLQERQADWRPPCQRGRTPLCVRERRHGAEAAVALPVPRLRVEPEAARAVESGWWSGRDRTVNRQSARRRSRQNEPSSRHPHQTSRSPPNLCSGGVGETKIGAVHSHWSTTWRLHVQEAEWLRESLIWSCLVPACKQARHFGYFWSAGLVAADRRQLLPERPPPSRPAKQAIRRNLAKPAKPCRAVVAPGQRFPLSKALWQAGTIPS